MANNDGEPSPPGAGLAQSGRGRQRPPLNPASLRELAIAYTARFATSSGRLELYLQRKLRERGWSEGDAKGGSAADPAACLAALARECARLGYCDDEAYARNRSAGLFARGYGPRRVDEALRQAGIGRELSAALAPDAAAERKAALRMMQKRRLGAYCPEDRMPGPDPARRAQQRQKHLAAMLRAGHALAVARALLAMPSPAAAERWAAQPDEEEDAPDSLA